jgi:amidase
VIPITSRQDTIGPIGRSIVDAAAVLSVIVGYDSRDNDTAAIPQPIPDYMKALKLSALRGKRIGVPRKGLVDPKLTNITQFELDTFNQALKTIEALGATIVENANLSSIEEIYGIERNKSDWSAVHIVSYKARRLPQTNRDAGLTNRIIA